MFYNFFYTIKHFVLWNVCIQMSRDTGVSNI